MELDANQVIAEMAAMLADAQIETAKTRAQAKQIVEEANEKIAELTKQIAELEGSKGEPLSSPLPE